jgi:hypothetical protein
LSGIVRWSRFLFNVLAWIFVACVAFQIYLAGVGVFSTGNFDPHRGFAIFGLLTIVMFVVALAARAPGWVIGGSALLFGLFFLQSIFVAMRESAPSVAALHPLNGFLIGLVSVVIAWRTRGWLRAPEPAVAPEAAPETKLPGA